MKLCCGLFVCLFVHVKFKVQLKVVGPFVSDIDRAPCASRSPYRDFLPSLHITKSANSHSTPTTQHNGAQTPHQLGVHASLFSPPRYPPPSHHKTHHKIRLDDRSSPLPPRTLQPTQRWTPHPLRILHRRPRPQRLYSPPTHRCPRYKKRHDCALRPRNRCSNTLYSPPTRPRASRRAQNPREEWVLRCTSRSRLETSQ